MSETRKIVILGVAIGGMSVAHYLARHVLPKLEKVPNVKYEMHLVDQSTHFWWHVSAPRAIASLKEMKHSDTFVPIMDGFKQYTNLKDAIYFHHGTITGVDMQTRTVSIKTAAGTDEALDYYALIIATGFRSETPLTTLQGDHTLSQQALDNVNAKLATAKEIVIAGGGPIGVETAGELATHLHGRAKITLITGGTKLLPILRQGLSDKAHKLLEKSGVNVQYNARVASSHETADGKTSIQLENGQTLTADIYIPAIGVKPNTDFLPANLKQRNGYVKTNGQTLRVDDAGPRVYAVGDVAGVNAGGHLAHMAAFPIAAANISHDLLADAKAGTWAEKTYQRKDGETQIVPVGPKTGVGAFNGWSMPGFAISMIKGKDYFLSKMPGFTEGKDFVKA